MEHAFLRTQLLLGKEAMEKLAASAVVIFGVGGVGSYAAEAVARSGVGRIDLVDDDVVCLTNINRQLPATRRTVGLKKAEVMRQRILDINPDCDVRALTCYYDAGTAGEFDLAQYDYVVDAIDTVTSKLILIERAIEAGVPIISSMGAGNKLDPTALQVADIYKTSVCPLARVMRRELKKRGVKALRVVYSKEPPLTPQADGQTGCKGGCVCPPGATRNCAQRRQVPGSMSFVPSAAGLILASQVILDLAGNPNFH